MTTTTTSKKPTSPDDLCGVCQTTRENHGDRHHVFSIEGNLEEVGPRPEPRQTPPQERKSTLSPEAKALTQDVSASLTLRLIEVLTSRGVLKGKDLYKIFGGEE